MVTIGETVLAHTSQGWKEGVVKSKVGSHYRVWIKDFGHEVTCQRGEMAQPREVGK